jgi:hypothetical protein
LLAVTADYGNPNWLAATGSCQIQLLYGHSSNTRDDGDDWPEQRATAGHLASPLISSRDASLVVKSQRTGADFPRLWVFRPAISKSQAGSEGLRPFALWTANTRI